MIRRRRFRAMGTDVEILIDSDSDAGSSAGIAAAEREVRRLEAILSRFRDTSELCRLNRLGALAAGPELAEVLGLALAGRESTGGRFDPTVHDAVVASGYDRPFEEVRAAGPGPAPDAHPPCGGGVRLDRASGLVSLEPGVRIDLGGIAKGWTADRVSAGLADWGPCLVNVGGDLATRGVPAEGAWSVGVDAPGGGLSLSLERGAMATSGRDRRRWRRSGRDAHHVIDPATGRPATTDLLCATVVASSAAWAEVLATAFLVAGADAAALEADALGVPCVLVGDDGALIRAGGALMHHDPTFWILARASGLLAVALLAGTACAGLVLRGRPPARLRPAAVTDVHRFTSLLALLAVAGHGAALVLDRTVEVSPLALVVPGLVPYRPVWTGLGVLTAWLMLVLHISFRLRGRIGARAWRRLHRAAYAAVAGGVLHGLLAGSDAGRPWAVAGYVAIVAAVGGLTAWRATAAPRGRGAARGSVPVRAARR